MFSPRWPQLRAFATTCRRESDRKFVDKVKIYEAVARQKAPEWQKRNEAIRARYGVWNPSRRLSIQQIQDLRDLKAKVPHLKTKDLADLYHISPEAVRRILKSKWVPKDEEVGSVIERAERRKARSREHKQHLLNEVDGLRDRLDRLTPVVAREPVPPPEGASTRGTRSRRRPSSSSSSSSPKHRGPFTPSVGDIID